MNSESPPRRIRRYIARWNIGECPTGICATESFSYKLSIDEDTRIRWKITSDQVGMDQIQDFLDEVLKPKKGNKNEPLKRTPAFCGSTVIPALTLHTGSRNRHDCILRISYHWKIYHTLFLFNAIVRMNYEFRHSDIWAEHLKLRSFF